MSEVKLLAPESLGRGFVSPQYLPPGQDEYYLRNAQARRPAAGWRHLRAEEIEALVKNDNHCQDWDAILVADPFTPKLIKNSQFFGLVRIGKLEPVILEHHELKLPAGIADSLIISCDIGENCAVHNVRYLSHYLLGDRVVLFNVDEMNTTEHAKFGNGILKDGEPEELRIWMDLMNEAGGRSVLPFDGMLAADAYLWAKYRDDLGLMHRLAEITQRQFDSRRGFYGTIGDQCVIKNSRILKDVKVGPHCYIKGANKLKNLTINSSRAEPSQIGEGVEMVNGIVGLGCHIFYGCKAVRFVMGTGAKLKYGARLIHSYLGDNSTVSCCEILNNLVFPAHEQHHNNSFLTASLVMGQSNIAAGATLGSNHNSRANDGEIQAGRGFWPGLCVTLKHNCRFASFVLVVKGSYPAELDIPLPFALVSDDAAERRLNVMPAYWWLHNMYALARNAWKFQTRDKRQTKTQHIEFDSLAPDTAEEMFRAMELLEIWTAKAHLRSRGQTTPFSPGFPTPLSPGARGVGGEGDGVELRRLGRDLLSAAREETADLEVLAEGLENSSRKTVILKAREGYHAYREMLHYYAVKNLLAYLEARPQATLVSMAEELAGPRRQHWVNLGGQLVPVEDVDRLLDEIKSGRLASWPDVHRGYDVLWEAYPLEKQRHAFATLRDLLSGRTTVAPFSPCGRGIGGEGEEVLKQRPSTETLTVAQWLAAFEEAERIQQHVCNQVLASRKKDYDAPFRRITFRNSTEMRAVLGTVEDNDFVKRVRQQTRTFQDAVRAIKSRTCREPSSCHGQP